MAFFSFSSVCACMHPLFRLDESLLGIAGNRKWAGLWCCVTGSSRLYHGRDRWRERWKRWIRGL